jgi:hypothetical protein
LAPGGTPRPLNGFHAPSHGNLSTTYWEVNMYIGGGALLVIVIILVLFLIFR